MLDCELALCLEGDAINKAKNVVKIYKLGMSYEGWEIAEKVPPGKTNSRYGEKSWFGSILCND